MPVHGESIELPEPFRVGPGTMPLWVEFAMPASLVGEAMGDLPLPPFPPWSVSCAFDMACTLLGQAAWVYGGAAIRVEVTKWDDEGNPLEWWYPYAGGGLVELLDQQGFGLRQTINTPGLDGKRNIPLLEGMPEPAGLLDEVDATTYDGHGVKLYLDKSKSFGALHYMPSLRPLRTDLDMELGCVTWGDSHSQQAPEHLVDPVAGVVVSVDVKLPPAPQGYQGGGTPRTVCLSWPMDCFLPTDGNGDPVEVSYDFAAGLELSTQTGPGDQTFTWLLTRTESPMPSGGRINANVENLPAGDPRIAPILVGNIAVRPGGIGSTEATEISKIEFIQYFSGRVEWPEEDLLPMKSGESLDKGVLFAYGVKTEPLEADPNVSWEVWNTDWVDEPLAAGLGKEFTARVNREGTTVVRYYADRNRNCRWDWPNEERGVSPAFKVKPIKEWKVKVARHQTVFVTPAWVTACLRAATEVVRRRDGEDDWRACAEFTLAGGQITTWDTAGADVWGDDNAQKLLDTVKADFCIVRRIWYLDEEGKWREAAGEGWKGKGALVEVAGVPPGLVWAHEWGHVLDLKHYDVNDYLMSSKADVEPKWGPYLTLSHAHAFEGE